MSQEIANSTLIDTWASSGVKIEPDVSKIIEGWQLGEQPPHEYMNWLQNTFGSKLNHILKNGVAKWNDETPYLAGATIQHNGSIWICQETNVNSEPTEANNNWDRIPSLENLAITVDTINDFPAGATMGDTCIVKDLDRGGIFIYDSTKVSEHNGGTNFNGWIRQYSGAVNVKWFGAKGDGVTDDTVAIQNAIDSSNGSLEVSDGEFIVTTLTLDSSISISGNGVFKRKVNYEVDNASAGAHNTTMFDIINHGIEVKFNGITFDGNEQNQVGYEPSGTLIRAYDLAGTATSVLKIDISNCTFKNQTRSSLSFKGSETTPGQELATVTNCWFSEGRKGIGAGDPRVVNPSGFAPTYINANDGFKVNVDNCKFTFTQTLSAVEPLDYAPCGIKFTYVDENLNVGGSSGVITNNLFYKLGRSDHVS